MMTANVLTVPVTATMYDAFGIVHCHGVRQLPVVDGKRRLVGVVTPRSLMKAMLPDGEAQGAVAGAPELIRQIGLLAAKKVSDHLEREFASVFPEASLPEVAALMTAAGRHAESVLVVDDARVLLGIISPRDVFKRLWDYSEKIGK